MLLINLAAVLRSRLKRRLGCGKFGGGYSQDGHPWGSEASKTGQRKKFSCEAVTTKDLGQLARELWSWDGP